MSVMTEPSAAEAQAPTEPIWRLSVEQYHRMIEAGILGDDDPVELLDGWLVVKMTKNRPHSIATHQTRKALAKVLPAGWYADSQEPITTADSEPEPDVTVICGEPQDYPDRHPGPADVALVVEVADVSLKRDRTTKKQIYAAAGVGVYWIVNVLERCVEVYTEPTGAVKQADYRKRQTCGADDSVPLVLDGSEVACLAVKELLP